MKALHWILILNLFSPPGFSKSVYSASNYKKTNRIFSKTNSKDAKIRFFSFNQFKKLKYNQKLVYIQYLSSLQTMMDLVRHDVKELPSKYGASLDPKIMNLILEDWAESVIPSAYAEEKVTQTSNSTERTQNKNEKSEVVKNLDLNKSAPQWAMPENLIPLFPDKKNNSEPLNQEFSEAYSQSFAKMNQDVTDLALKEAQKTQNPTQNEEEIRRIVSESFKNPNEILSEATNGSGSVTSQMEATFAKGSKDLSKEIAIQNAREPYSKEKGALCIYGNERSTYVVHKDGKIKCRKPNRLNTDRCRIEGTDSWECPNFGLYKNDTINKNDKTLCVPYYDEPLKKNLTPRLDKLTIKCNDALSNYLKSKPEYINEEEYNQVIKNLKTEFKDFLISKDSKNLSIEEYCKDNNIMNNQAQAPVCIRIISMNHTLSEIGLQSEVDPNGDQSAKQKAEGSESPPKSKAPESVSESPSALNSADKNPQSKDSRKDNSSSKPVVPLNENTEPVTPTQQQ